MSHKITDQLELTQTNERVVALATLVAATGSSSKRIGAEMIVGASGRLLGGVTIGGCIDAQVIAAADALVAAPAGARRLLSIALDDDDAWEIGLTCGGTVDVLVERLEPGDATDPLVTARAVVRKALERGDAAVLVTPVDGPRAALVVDDSGLIFGTLNSKSVDASAAAVARGVLDTSPRVEAIETPAGARRFFFDRFAPPTTLVIVGAGEIAVSLTRLARELEMRTVVIDGRERYATRERFAEADDVRVGMPSEIVASLNANRRLAIVLVAHDYKYELPVLRQVLRAPVGYIGLLGSKKRGAAVRDILRDEGFTDEELRRIHTPIGLDLGGKSSAEVALAILAEIVAVRSGRAANA